jgi:hypothetical protein
MFYWLNMATLPFACDLGEIGWGDVDWIDLTQDRDQWRALVNTGSIKCWEILE